MVPERHRVTPRKVLQVAAVGGTVRFLLLPLIKRLQEEGCIVHGACSPGPHVHELRREGLVIHSIRLDRRILSVRHITCIIQLIWVMRRNRYDVVHVHTPVAAALARIAARISRVPLVIYTAHGFFFHDRMPALIRRPIIWVERVLGRCCTDVLMTQSREDYATAVRERLIAPDSAVWIGNGVDVDRFDGAVGSSLREGLGISTTSPVIGFVGRLVREKGVYDLVEAMRSVRSQHVTAVLLVVGSQGEGERSRDSESAFHRFIDEQGLDDAVVLAGFRENVEKYYAVMDVFVLPSHREGMPRSIIEAMASGKPVVASDIRGCREEVIDGITGTLFPPGDVAALAEALRGLLSNPLEARRMGAKGREVARLRFREKDVLDREMAVYGQHGIVPTPLYTNDEIDQSAGHRS